MTVQSAQTSDGKMVLLHSNGTWEYQETDIPDKIDAPSNKIFRDCSWGDSPAVIYGMHDEEPIHASDELIVFAGALSGYACSICYDFVMSQLYSGRYVFSDIFVENQRYIGFFETFKDQLSKKYGAPLRDEYIWIDDLYRDEPDEWGDAISHEGLVLLANWDLGETTIDLICNASEYDIKVTIQYESTRLKVVAENQNEQELLDQL